MGKRWAVGLLSLLNFVLLFALLLSVLVELKSHREAAEGARAAQEEMAKLKQRTYDLENRIRELELELADHNGQARQWRNDAAQEFTELRDMINLDRHYSRRP